MKVHLFDYGAGNIHSMRRALERAGAEVLVTREPAELLAAERLVLPGVGAFPAATAALCPDWDQDTRVGLQKMVGGTSKEAGKIPTLAVCVGYQALCSFSDEGAGTGLGAFRSKVLRLTAPRLPHMGWDPVTVTREDPIFEGIATGTAFYFAHSFAPAPVDTTIATAEHGAVFSAGSRRGQVWGFQFHPEKSGAPGRRLIENWVRLAGGSA